VVGKLWASAQLWAVLHLILGRATLSVVGRVLFKSYSPAPVAWIKAQATATTIEHCLYDVKKNCIVFIIIRFMTSRLHCYVAGN